MLRANQTSDRFLTTAMSSGDESEESTAMFRHFALIFLEDPDSIIKEIADSQDPMSPSLIQFIRCCRPTLSLIQIASISNLSYQTIILLARHLIYWRKARAIPPLHHKNYYIVSPNADMHRLPSHSALYASLFPTYPSLPKLLSLLSSKPRPYVTFIPS